MTEGLSRLDISGSRLFHLVCRIHNGLCSLSINLKIEAGVRIACDSIDEQQGSAILAVSSTLAGATSRQRLLHNPGADRVVETHRLRTAGIMIIVQAKAIRSGPTARGSVDESQNR